MPTIAEPIDLDALLRRLTHAVCDACGAVDPPTVYQLRDGRAVPTHDGCPESSDGSNVLPHGVLSRAEQVAVVRLALDALERPAPRFVDVDLTPEDFAADAGERVIA